MPLSIVRIDWPTCHRIVGTLYPPVPIFEDAAIDPADWSLLLSIAAKTDPTVLSAAGAINQIPVGRRAQGPGASWANGPFAHASTSRPGRFSDGSYGVWYGGKAFEVALMETAHHFERFMAATNEPPGTRHFYELTARVTGELADFRTGHDPALDPNSWAVGQHEAKDLRKDGRDGILYPSVRWPGGEACALFYPDLIRLPLLAGRQFAYRWDGSKMTDYLVFGEPDWTALPTPPP